MQLGQIGPPQVTIGNQMSMTNSYSPWGSIDEVRRNREKRRSHIEVHAAVLKELASEYLSINQIAIRVNLNRTLAKSYVNELSQKGQVETRKIKGIACYSATQRGVAWLKRFESLARD